jgi:hypothetical protein
MQQTENPVVPSVAVASTPDSIGIVALDDQILAQVVGGLALRGPGTGWLDSLAYGPGAGW